MAPSPFNEEARSTYSFDASPSSPQTDVSDLLAFLGRAAEAEYVILAVWDCGSSASLKTQPHLVWHREGADSQAKLAAILEERPDENYRADPELAPDLVVDLALPGPLDGHIALRLSDPTERERTDYERLVRIVASSFLQRWRDKEADAAMSSLRRHAIASSAEAMIVTADGTVLFANPAAERVLEAPLQVLLGTSLDAHVDDDSRVSVSRHLAGAWAGNDVPPVRVSMATTSVPSQRVEISSSKISWGDGPAVVSVLRDVTAYEQRLDDYARLVSTAFESVWHVQLSGVENEATSPISLASHILRNGIIVAGNPGFRQLLETFGLRPKEEQRISRFATPSLFRLTRDFVDSGFQLNKYRIRVKGRNGIPRLFLVNATGREGRFGLTDIWGSCLEITDMVLMEERAAHLRERQRERIGQNLSEQVGSLLEVVRQASDEVIESIDEESRDLPSRLQAISSAAEQATTRLRQIYRNLVPGNIEEQDLSRILEDLAERAAESAGVRVGFTARGGARITDSNAKLRIYRTIQTALDRAIQDARATTVDISLVSERKRIAIQMTHDADAESDEYVASIRDLLHMHARLAGGRLTVATDTDHSIIFHFEFGLI